MQEYICDRHVTYVVPVLTCLQSDDIVLAIFGLIKTNCCLMI